MKKETEILNKKKINDDVTAYYEKLNHALFGLDNEAFYKYFENAFSNGNRTYYQKNIAETKKFDDTWIKTVESYFPSLDKITREPKSILKYEDDIVAIERAKKTGSRSVRHLASHTEYIRDIDAYNNVTPKKILVENAEQDYATYENRFIMTLINRLFLFVRNRYEIIKNNVESIQKDHLSGNVNFNFNDTKVEMNLDMTIYKDLDDKSINEHNHDLLTRTERLNYLITGLKNSLFMQMLKGANPVHPPIMKTNIITKNPEFRNAYNLWIFLDKYSILGYDVSIKEKDLEFDDNFLDDVNKIFAYSYVTVLGNQLNRLEKYNAPEGYEELIKKKTKIAKQNPKDFVPNPDLIEMEETHLNEYFLRQYKELLGMSIEKEMEEDENETEKATDIEIKRALRQTTEIVNGLYDAQFEISEESDILHRLEEKNLEKEYELTLAQLRYAKLIREVKEVDYNNFFRTERRLLRILTNTNTKMIKKLIEERKYEEKERKIKEIEKKIEELKKDNDERSKVIAALNDHQELMKEEKEKIIEERNKVINKVSEEMKAYDEMMAKKYEDERLRVLEALKAEKERSAKLKQEEDEARKYRKAALNEMINFEKEKVRAEEEAKYKAHKEELEEKLKSISDIEKRYKERMLKEVENKRAENAQKEKEAIAIFMVSKFEEREASLEKMRLEDANLAYNEEKALKEASEKAEQEKARLLEEETARAKESYDKSLAEAAILASSLDENSLQDYEAEKEERARLLEEQRLLEEKEKENEEKLLREKIQNDLLALEEEEEKEKEELKRKKKADKKEEEELVAIKEEYEKELQKEKFEQERLRIENEIAKNIEEENRLKAERIARNAAQREKEAKAIALLQEYERKQQEENEKLSLKEKAENLENKDLKKKQEFEDTRLNIEADVLEHSKLEEKKKKIKANQEQREKESKAISLVEDFEKKNSK